MENGKSVVNIVLKRRTIQDCADTNAAFALRTRKRLEPTKCYIRVEIVLLARR